MGRFSGVLGTQDDGTACFKANLPENLRRVATARPGRERIAPEPSGGALVLKRLR